LHRTQPLVADASAKKGEPPPPRPAALTKRGADVLVRVERLLDDATRALPVLNPTVSTGAAQRGAAVRQPDTVASAAPRKSGETTGGN
jgi:penicillin-binding protein 1A